MTAHSISYEQQDHWPVGLSPAWRPVCRCGWTGDWSVHQAVAEDEGHIHLWNREAVEHPAPTTKDQS